MGEAVPGTRCRQSRTSRLVSTRPPRAEVGRMASALRRRFELPAAASGPMLVSCWAEGSTNECLVMTGAEHIGDMSRTRAGHVHRQ